MLIIFFSEKNKERSTLNEHAAYSSPELKSCEHRLRCVVEGIEKDQLLVRFSDIDKLALEREFSFVLDVSSRSYKGACSVKSAFHRSLYSCLNSDTSNHVNAFNADVANICRGTE